MCLMVLNDFVFTSTIVLTSDVNLSELLKELYEFIELINISLYYKKLYWLIYELSVQ